MTDYKYIIITRSEDIVNAPIKIQKLYSSIELIEYEIVDMMVRDHGFNPHFNSIDIVELSDIKNLKGGD